MRPLRLASLSPAASTEGEHFRKGLRQQGRKPLAFSVVLTLTSADLNDSRPS